MQLLIDGEIFALQTHGGISRIYSELLPRVARLQDGMELVVVLKGDWVPPALRANGLRTEPIPSFSWPRRPWRVQRLMSRVATPWLVDRFWRTRKAKAFHPTYYGTPPIPCPSFCFVYDMIHELFPNNFSKAEHAEVTRAKALAVERAKIVLCISEHTKLDLIRILKVPESKCRVVYPGGSGWGARVGSKAGQENVHAGKPFLLYVGDYRTPYKNFSFLAKCLGDPLFRGFCEYDLVVVGSKPVNQELSQWDELLHERIKFCSNVTDGELASLYASCAALVYPSCYEGFGIPVAEALSMGTPVVCANAASLPEVGGGVAYYFDPQSPRELLSALDKAISDGRRPDLVQRRCDQAARFVWDKTAKEFHVACREVCEG